MEVARTKSGIKIVLAQRGFGEMVSLTWLHGLVY